MKRLTSLVVKSLVMLLIAGGMLATNLQAQSDDAITVRVPFPFTVGTETLAAGTYQFSTISNNFLLSVRNVKTGKMDITSVLPVLQDTVEQQGRLVLLNNEGSSVLNEVHFPGTSMFSVVQRRSSGRIEAKKPSTNSSICIALR